MHERCRVALANTLWEGGNLGLGTFVAVVALSNRSATTTTNWEFFTETEREISLSLSLSVLTGLAGCRAASAAI